MELVEVWGGCFSLFEDDYGCMCDLLADIKTGLE